jgi:hypothetical protein
VQLFLLLAYITFVLALARLFALAVGAVGLIATLGLAVFALVRLRAMAALTGAWDSSRRCAAD